MIKPNTRYVSVGTYKPRERRQLPRWVTIAIALIIAAVFFAEPSRTQLQQSGGGGSNASVGSTGATAPTSAALAGGTYSSSLPTLTTGQMGSEQLDSNARQIVVGAGTAGTATGGVESVQGVAGGTALPVSGTLSVNALPAGTNLIGYSRPPNGCGGTFYESGLTNVPTASTSVTATATCISLITLTNITSSAATVTVQDQSTNCNSTFCQVLSSFSIPGNSSLLLQLNGAKFTGGVKWNAGTLNAITGDIVGNQ